MTALLAQALACWGWQQASCHFVAGRENQVFRVSAPEGEFALRIKRPGYRHVDELHAELQWLRALAQAGVSVPTPQPSLVGRGLEAVEGHWVDALRWLPGQPLGQSGQALALPDAPDTFRRLGVLMAQLHQACDDWPVPPTFRRWAWDREGLLGEQPLWGRFWDHPDLDADTRELMGQFRRRADAALREAQDEWDYGLIHADWVRENVLQEGSRLHVIDFDDGGWGYRLFDVATALIKNRAEPAFADLRAALIHGYRSIRPLDVRQLDLFMALRAVTYVGWIVPRLHEPGALKRQTRLVRDARDLCLAWLTQA